MIIDELQNYDGLGLAELLRSGEINLTEVLNYSRSRISKYNDQLGAVLYTLPHDQTPSKRPSKGPFAGVPFLLKDLGMFHKDYPSSHGSRLFQDYKAPVDSELVRRFIDAGVIILGRTNTPEFGLSPVTEPEAFFPARTPWNLGHTSGGSSGGSAAAVAARMVPIASAGDGGGSIRMPASCCGIFGLKPTRGRNPMGPLRGESWQGFVAEHILSISVRDSATMLDETCAPEPGSYYYTAQPTKPFASAIKQPPRKLRIAFSTEASITDSFVHEDCQSGVQKTVQLLEDLGHQCVEMAPAIDKRQFVKSYMTTICGDMASALEFAQSATGNRVSNKTCEATTLFTSYMGSVFNAQEFATALQHLKSLGHSVAQFMLANGIDVLLTPTLASPPARIGQLAQPFRDRFAQKAIRYLHAGKFIKNTEVFMRSASEVFAYMPFTPVANVTGQPSMSVPLYWNQSGLPIGSMFTGLFGEDATLLQLAAQLEDAQPWAQKMPPLITKTKMSQSK